MDYYVTKRLFLNAVLLLQRKAVGIGVGLGDFAAVACACLGRSAVQDVGVAGSVELMKVADRGNCRGF